MVRPHPSKVMSRVRFPLSALDVPEVVVAEGTWCSRSGADEGLAEETCLRECCRVGNIARDMAQLGLAHQSGGLGVASSNLAIPT